MSRILQIVIDTNILVAAFRSQRGVANFLRCALASKRLYTFVAGIRRRLKRPAMSGFIKETDVDVFLHGLCSIAVHHDIFYLWRLLAKDPDDSFLLELTVRANAGFIITYNPKDFPAAASFGIKLATPKEFLQFVGDLP